jgi:hypothetical protein
MRESHKNESCATIAAVLKCEKQYRRHKKRKECKHEKAKIADKNSLTGLRLSENPKNQYREKDAVHAYPWGSWTGTDALRSD